MTDDRQVVWRTLAIAVGGGLGTATRYELGLHFAPPTPPDFPWVTFGVNVTGALLLGFVATMLAGRWARTTYVGPLVATGFLGGYTTWSHFITESDQLIGSGERSVALVYMLGSIALGLLAAAIGAAAAGVINRPAPAEGTS